MNPIDISNYTKEPSLYYEDLLKWIAAYLTWGDGAGVNVKLYPIFGDIATVFATAKGYTAPNRDVSLIGRATLLAIDNTLDSTVSYSVGAFGPTVSLFKKTNGVQEWELVGTVSENNVAKPDPTLVNAVVFFRGYILNAAS